MGDLTIYINGPSAADVKAFVNWNGKQYRIGLLQRFSLLVSTDTFLPRITMTLPALNLHDEAAPEVDDSTVRIVLEEAVTELEGLEAKVRAGCKVMLGEEPIAMLRSVSLEVVAGATDHVFNLSFAKGINETDWKTRWDSRVDEIPKWINIDGMNRLEDQKLEWTSTEYAEESNKENDEK